MEKVLFTKRVTLFSWQASVLSSCWLVAADTAVVVSLYFMDACASVFIGVFAISVSAAQCLAAEREAGAAKTRRISQKPAHTPHRPQPHDRYVCVSD